ncbi:MAG TPA: hypothetical protein VK106_02990 [Balneolaceae bacterium]|nr:hypothetical protein [Balneolaceae bacterium]
MNAKKGIKYIFIVVVFVIAGFALADSLGFFNPKPYTKVPHGSHYHYVPKNRDSNVGIDKFPENPPGPGEMITPTGQVVPIDSFKTSQDIVK